MAEKLTPKDVQYKTAVLNGKTYSYILAEPQGKYLNTIFLVHGWPDMVGLSLYKKPSASIRAVSGAYLRAQTTLLS